ncbi:MAG: DNA repair protein RecO [Calditerrivibrio sp.]|nr:DNA repair protein RecO [Calditerrivibrio sp.]
MGVVKTRGIIYRIVKYSEKSAICHVFTEDKGKIKIFIPNAYGRHRTLQKLYPSEIGYVYKETTDLHRFLEIEYLHKYSFFHECVPLYFRLNLFFEIVDHLLPYDYVLEELWRYLMGLNTKNYKKGIFFMIMFIMDKAGLIRHGECCLCGLSVYEGCICKKCVGPSDRSLTTILSLYYKKDLLKQAVFDDILFFKFLKDYLKRNNILLRSVDAITELDSFI